MTTICAAKVKNAVILASDGLRTSTDSNGFVINKELVDKIRPNAQDLVINQNVYQKNVLATSAGGSNYCDFFGNTCIKLAGSVDSENFLSEVSQKMSSFTRETFYPIAHNLQQGIVVFADDAKKIDYHICNGNYKFYKRGVDFDIFGDNIAEIKKLVLDEIVKDTLESVDELNISHGIILSYRCMKTVIESNVGRSNYPINIGLMEKDDHGNIKTSRLNENEIKKIDEFIVKTDNIRMEKLNEFDINVHRVRAGNLQKVFNDSQSQVQLVE